MDSKFINICVDLATEAYEQGFSPVGAALVKDNTVVATASSKRKIGNLMHAEYQLISQNQEHGLIGMTLYTTLEPCIMCGAMAIVGKIDRVVYVLEDLWGGWLSCTDGSSEYIQTRKTIVEQYNDPVVYEACREMLVDYFTKAGDEWAVKKVLG